MQYYKEMQITLQEIALTKANPWYVPWHRYYFIEEYFNELTPASKNQCGALFIHELYRIMLTN